MFPDAALMYGRQPATRFRATLHVLHVAPQRLDHCRLGAENYAIPWLPVCKSKSRTMRDAIYTNRWSTATEAVC